MTRVSTPPEPVALAPELRWPPLHDIDSGGLPAAIDTGARAAVVGTVAVDRGPIGDIAVSADGHRLMVTNCGDDSVSMIDTDTGTVVQTIVDTPEPFPIATGHTGRAYVGTAATAFDSVLAIDTDTAGVAEAYPVASSIDGLAVDPCGQRVYVACTAAPGVDVTAIDVAQGPVHAVDLSTAPGAAAACVRVSPNGRRLYVAVQRPDGDVVIVMDPDLGPVATIEVGSTIRDVAVSPDGDTVLVASCDPRLGGVVEVVDAHTNVVTDRFETGDPMTQLTVSGDGERAYLVTADGIAVLCTRTHRLVDTIAVGAQPSGAVESPDGHRLYIADYAGAVTTVSVASPAVSLPAPHWLDDTVTALLELEPAAV